MIVTNFGQVILVILLTLDNTKLPLLLTLGKSKDISHIIGVIYGL